MYKSFSPQRAPSTQRKPIDFFLGFFSALFAISAVQRGLVLGLMRCTLAGFATMLHE
jgi:hypothetical protein